MLGAGTKTGITAARHFPVLLDITRLISRVGRGPATGIDRVELAYLQWVLNTEPDVFGLARLADGLVLLDRSGMTSVLDRLLGHVQWGARDVRARVGFKTSAARGAAESDLRRLAVSRPKTTLDLKALAGLLYLNVGHSNLNKDVLADISGSGLDICVFLHDVIPIETPQYQRPETEAQFRGKTAAVRQYATYVITNSEDSLARIKGVPELAEMPVDFAHLGVDVQLDESKSSPLNRPYLITVGTIEPRKNYALLWDIWDELGEDAPELHIVGQRGWASEQLIGRFDQGHPRIREHSGLPDTELWSLLRGAHALLFPSFSEGFGLPSLEAAALGVPVLCGDLAIHRELLGQYPIYASTADRYLWKKTIIELANQELNELRATFAPRRPRIPTWDAHFSHVNHVIMQGR